MTVTLTAVIPQTDAAALDSLAGPARALLAAAADGNGLSAAQVRLSREETQTHRLTGEISVTFHAKLKQEPGQPPAGAVTVADETAARAAADAHTATLSADRDLAQLIDRELRKQPGQGFGIPDVRFNLGAATEKTWHAAGVNYIARYVAEAKFTLWRQGADVTALAAAEMLGLSALADDSLGDVFIAPLAPDGARLKSECAVFLPVSKIEFSLEGRFFPAVAAGRHGQIVEMDAALDRWLKPGIAALLKLSRGPLAVDALAATALKYRLIRQTLQALLHQPRKAVYAQLQRDYPLGVSDKYLRACIKYADGAGEALTRGNRRQSLTYILGISLGISAAYYLAGLRGLVFGGQDQPAFVVADVLLWALVAAGGVYLIRRRAARHLKMRLGADRLPETLPPASLQGRLAVIYSGLIFAGMAFAAPAKPAWAAAVIAKATGLLGF